MNRMEFVDAITIRLKEKGATKTAPSTRNVFFITDEDGNQSQFSVTKKGREMRYNQSDVAKIIEAAMTVVEDCMRRGEELYLRNFCRLYIHRRAERTVRHPATGQISIVPVHYVPKFDAFSRIKRNSNIYEKKLKNPDWNYEDDEELQKEIAKEQEDDYESYEEGIFLPEEEDEEDYLSGDGFIV